MKGRGRTTVVIAGGGVAGLEAVLTLRALTQDRVDIELLAPETHFWYRPLVVAEPFELGEPKRFELAALASRVGASFTPGALAGDRYLEAGRVHSRGRSVFLRRPYRRLRRRPCAGVYGAVTFRGPADTDAIRHLLDEAATGVVRRVAFVVPWGAVWSLPAYELALLTDSCCAPTAWRASMSRSSRRRTSRFTLRPAGERRREGPSAGARHRRPHARECDQFPRRRARPRSRRDRRGRPRRRPAAPTGPADRRPHAGSGRVRAGRRALPSRRGDRRVRRRRRHELPREAGRHRRAASRRCSVRPKPFRPVLRGLILTGDEPRYARTEIDRPGDVSRFGTEPLWWPPAKIAGCRLAPFLSELAGGEAVAGPETGPGTAPVEVEFDPELVSA